MRVLALLLVLFSAACSTAVPAPAPSPAARTSTAADSLAGTLRLVGSAPVNTRLVLTTPSASITVGGPMRDELGRLTGAEVVLFGRRQGQSFEATDYRIRAVDGQPVVMGIVEAISDAYLRLRTAEGELVYLVSPPGEFRPGQKVWVQGPRAVIVQSFGTVRP